MFQSITHLCIKKFTKNGKLKFNIDWRIQNSSSVCDKSTAANNKHRRELTNLHKTGVNPYQEISIKILKKNYLIPSEENFQAYPVNAIALYVINQSSTN